MKRRKKVKKSVLDYEARKMPSPTYEEIWKALEESIALQAHYAGLLNEYDGGKRIVFRNVYHWLDRVKSSSEAEERKG